MSNQLISQQLPVSRLGPVGSQVDLERTDLKHLTIGIQFVRDAPPELIMRLHCGRTILPRLSQPQGFQRDG